jgi:anti-anti-sigma factor
MTASVTIENLEKYSILHLEGDFNGVEENDLLLTSFRELSTQKRDVVLVNLKNVQYLNSASIGVLLSGNALIKKIGGKIILYNASDYLENTFSVTKLNLALTICKDFESAINTI